MSDTATIKLTGETKRQFDVVKAHMKTVLPTVDPNNREVIGHALFMSSREIGAESEPDVTSCMAHK